MAIGPGTDDPLAWLEHDIDALVTPKTTQVDHTFQEKHYPGLEQRQLDSLATKYSELGWKVVKIEFDLARQFKTAPVKVIRVGLSLA